MQNTRTNVVGPRLRALCAVALLLVTSACGDAPSRSAGDGAAAPAQPDPHAGLFDGHDLAAGGPAGRPPPGMPGHGLPPGGTSGHGGPSGPHWEWDTPPAWKTIAPKALTEVTFTVAEDPRAFVTMTVLAGGGAPLENVNRWRGQMGAPPLAALEDSAAATIQLLGGTGHFVRIDGSYTGMGGKDALREARMLGVIRDHPDGRVFLKMIGSRETLAAQEAAFRTWAASIRRTTLPGVPPFPTPPAQKVLWDPPKGWLLQPPRPMREVTYKPGAESAVECYITILGAGAADVAANIQIWQGQVGKPALSAEAIAGLPRIRVLGQDVPLLQAEGAFKGSGGQHIPDAALLGVVCARGDHAVFVKMIGPRSEVLAQRPAFEAFCRSLRDPK